MFTNPIPPQSELNQLYSSQSELVLGSLWVENYLKGESNPTRNEILEEIKVLKPESILEVGCGDGLLLKKLEDHGFIACGVEPGNWINKSNIFDSLESLPRKSKFDCLILQDVLEHVENPIDFLFSYMDKTKDKTYLIITIPAGDSLEAKILGIDWEMVRPFGHLHYFSKESLKALARGLGLKVHEIRRFRRESRIKSLSRIILLPFLWTRQTLSQNHETNPYLFNNLGKYLALGLSQGDQYYVVLSKSQTHR